MARTGFSLVMRAALLIVVGVAAGGCVLYFDDEERDQQPPSCADIGDLSDQDAPVCNDGMLCEWHGDECCLVRYYRPPNPPDAKCQSYYQPR